MSDLADLSNRFKKAGEFTTSPLYSALAPVVAADRFLLSLASKVRRGQQPTYLFLAAVHFLLLAGAKHELAIYYPSIVGPAASPPSGAGPALISFCRQFEVELTELLQKRLVQTNNVKRSLALKVGLWAINRHVSAPVHVVEVGASAGIHLRFNRYGYRIRNRQFGPPSSPVQIETQWRGTGAVPDLDRTPRLATVTGVDLNPLDAANSDDRRWLEALVWPENRLEADLLEKALVVVASDPPPIMAGDAIEVCPVLARTLPQGEPRFVFHAATRMHVSEELRARFDEAIASLGAEGPLWRLALEPDPTRPADKGGFLTLRHGDGPPSNLAIVDGHLEWIELLDTDG